MSVTIGVTGPGSVVVSTTSALLIFHLLGTTDLMQYATGTNAMDCAGDGASQVYSVHANLADSILHIGGASVEVFTVAGPGSFTYYLNAFMSSGASTADDFNAASMVAVFYPS